MPPLTDYEKAALSIVAKAQAETKHVHVKKERIAVRKSRVYATIQREKEAAKALKLLQLKADEEKIKDIEVLGMF